MTELLYMRDNYVKEFEAVVEKVTEDSIITDRSAFYPEGGGQVGDRGFFKNANSTMEVVNTKRRNRQVHHISKDEIPFDSGDRVLGILDWDRRYELMRFHTAQHLISRYLQMNYDLETVGNQIKPGQSRADYSPINDFTNEMIADLEEGIADLVSKGIDVQIQFMPREKAVEFLHERGYQTRYLDMVPDSVKEFRILLIGDYDASSCAGTHVRNTREIGGITIDKTKNVGSGKQRIYFSLT
jgi:Ser-tRNA(Ala) deacylase AlaX